MRVPVTIIIRMKLRKEVEGREQKNKFASSHVTLLFSVNCVSMYVGPFSVQIHFSFHSACKSSLYSNETGEEQTERESERREEKRINIYKWQRANKFQVMKDEDESATLVQNDERDKNPVEK